MSEPLNPDTMLAAIRERTELLSESDRAVLDFAQRTLAWLDAEPQLTDEQRRQLESGAGMLEQTSAQRESLLTRQLGTTSQIVTEARRTGNLAYLAVQADQLEQAALSVRMLAAIDLVVARITERLADRDRS